MKLKSFLFSMGVVALFAAGPASAANEPTARIILAQSGEATYRVNQMEDQIRQLNGRIEELNFQLLQLQEQIRKMQEDNEFRFQELEERGEAGGKRKSIGDLLDKSDATRGKNKPGKLKPSDRTAKADRSGGKPTSSRKTRKKTIDGVELYDGPSGVDTRKPGTLGSQIFDNEGKIIEAPAGKPLDLTKSFDKPVNSNLVLPDNPDALYTLGYDYIQSGDYALAEEVFNTFLDRYSDHRRTADVGFWLGESHFARGQYDDAAEVFLETHKKYPGARLAPQALLKLGVSLAGLNQRELACATYAEVNQKYPNSSSVVKNSVVAEQKAANCIN